VQRFTPLVIDAARPGRHPAGDRGFVDETYVKVAGVWRYVYRAVDQHGQVIDVYVHHAEPAQPLLGLYVRSVGDQHVTIGGVGGVDRAVLLQPLGEDVHASSLHLVHDPHGERPAPAERLFSVVAHPLLVEVQEVLRHDCSFCFGDPVDRVHLVHERRRAKCDTVVPEMKRLA
jgi:hypothetical protein